jgi:hypothetical protein
VEEEMSRDIRAQVVGDVGHQAPRFSPEQSAHKGTPLRLVAALASAAAVYQLLRRFLFLHLAAGQIRLVNITIGLLTLAPVLFASCQYAKLSGLQAAGGKTLSRRIT